MSKTKVYDLPTRLFHWLFAGVFLGTFFIAKALDDESPAFAYHMLLGLTLAVIVGFRLIWGLLGSRYARFSSFALRPSELWRYFTQIITGTSPRTPGHNPASSWAALVMMGLALALAVTGYLMTSGNNKEALEDIHELMANTFVIVVILHVAGVIAHSLRHKDHIALSMLNGEKLAIEGQQGIERSHGGVAILFLAAVGAFAWYVGNNYDATARTLNLFGNTLTMGESEADKNGDQYDGQGENGDDDGDDD